MEWNGTGGKYFFTSDKGYRVSKTFSNGEARYGAWPPKKPKGELYYWALDYCDTLEEAQALCEAHHQANGEP